MKFLRSKLMLFFIIIVSLLCLVAFGISTKITTTILKRQNQIVKSLSPEEHELAKVYAKVVNINKFKDQTFFFNGEEIKGINAYSIDKKQFFVPIDVVFDKVGIKFKYYSSDELLEANINGEKLLIWLGKSSFLLGSKEIKLITAPITSKNHILVPVELFANLKGFITDSYGDKSTVFISYYPGYSPAVDSKTKVLRYVKGIASITDIIGNEIFWSSKTPNEGFGRYEFSKDASTFMVKADGEVYVVNSKNSAKPRNVSVDPSATLSDDGKYLYWVDETIRTSFIYDINKRTTKKLGDYFFKIKADNNAYLLYGGYVLSDYRQGTNYKRVSLTDVSRQGNYTFIERYGKVVLKGNMEFSPDRKKVLHYEIGKGYYVASADGTNIVFLGEFTGTQAGWINNNRIFIQNENKTIFFNKSGRNKTESNEIWRKVGQASDGSVFFTIGNALFYESKGVETKIINLPWKCKFVYAPTAAGPYIMASEDKDDGVYFMKGNTTAKLTNNGSLLAGTKDRDGNLSEYQGCLSISPTKSKAVVFSKENGFVSFNFINMSSGMKKKVILNCETDDNKPANYINSKWISDDRLFVYTQDRGWIIDLKDATRIYEMKEQAGSTIQGVTP